jgi:hypothetical protein
MCNISELSIVQSDSVPKPVKDFKLFVKYKEKDVLVVFDPTLKELIEKQEVKA